MKVLHLISSASWGGLEIYSSELVVRLHQAGHEVAAMVTSGSRVEAYLKSNAVPVFRGPKRIKSKVLGQSAVRKIIRSEKFDVIHCHTRMDLWFAALATTKESHKIVYNLYMNAPQKKGFVHRWLFGKISALCSSSEKICREVIENFDIDPNKVHLVRYGRDADSCVSNKVVREKLRHENKVLPGQYVFTSLARLDEGKGIFELIMAMKFLSDDELKRCQLWIIGEPTIAKQDGEKIIYEEQSLKVFNFLKAMMASERYKNHIRHFGFQKNFLPFLDATDVFCIASYNETYSLSVIDAELMGKPVLGTNAGGTIEQVGESKRGVLVEPKSSEALAEGMKFFLIHPDEILRMGQEAATWSRSQHSWQSAIRQTLAIYDKV